MRLKCNYWVGNNVWYDHLFIIIQLEKEDRKPPFTFKSNHDWLDKEYFTLLIIQNNFFYDPCWWDSVMLQFSSNLKQVKKLVVESAKMKKEENQVDLENVEES